MFKVKDVVVSISQITYVTLRTICGEHVPGISCRLFRNFWKAGR